MPTKCVGTYAPPPRQETNRQDGWRNEENVKTAEKSFFYRDNTLTRLWVVCSLLWLIVLSSFALATEPGGAFVLLAAQKEKLPVVAANASYAGKDVPEDKDIVAPVVPLGAEPFDLEDVRLLDGPFNHAMELDRDYLLSLDPDRLLHLFRLKSGLPSTVKPYGGWMDHTGEFVGHYLSACALIYASTGDERLKAKGEQVIAGLAQCQDKLGSGFLNDGHGEFAPDQGPTNGILWYSTHKFLMGLLEMNRHCHSQQALNVARKLGEFACAVADRTSDDYMQKMVAPEVGGINEAFANLYARTGDARFLKLALRFNWKGLRLQDTDSLHSNSTIPRYIGLARQYELTGDESFKTTAQRFWEKVVNENSYVNGNNGFLEHFTSMSKLPDALGYSTGETCCAYNMLKLTLHLFEWDPQAAYFDFYEPALYNDILASQDPETGMMAYFCPLGPGSKKTYSTPEDSFWCCMGTGVENHAKYGDSIYFHHGQATIFVNLFIPSELNWRAQGVRLRQETKYPDEGATHLVIACKKPVRLNVQVRCPAWATAGFEIRVNGAKLATKSTPGSYVTVARQWVNGDTVDVSMPFSVRTEGFRSNPRRLAFLHGPLVLCAGTKYDFSAAGVAASKLRGPDVQQAERNWPLAYTTPFPAVVAEQNELATLLKPVPGKPSTFTASAAAFRLPDAKDSDLVTFEPYHKMHEGRKCVVYWDMFTPAEWQALGEVHPSPSLY
jgi:hypothetical protein